MEELSQSFPLYNHDDKACSPSVGYSLGFLGQKIPGGGWSSASAPPALAGSRDSGWKRMME